MKQEIIIAILFFGGIIAVIVWSILQRKKIFKYGRLTDTSPIQPKSIKGPSQRTCPSCNNKMVLFECSSFDIDFCKVCRGLWFDFQELAKVCKTPIVFLDLVNGEVNERLLCGSCSTVLKDYYWKYKNNHLSISECPGCRGKWVDNKTIQEIRNMLPLLKSKSSFSKPSVPLREYRKQTKHFVGFGTLQDPLYSAIYYCSEKNELNTGGIRLICPRCNQETRKIKESEVVVDVCDKCRGIFLDKGELNKIAEPSIGDIEFCTVAGETFDHSDRFKEIHCPKCEGTPMKKVDFNIYTDIILDYCESCKGFWLDGGEYSRINDEIRGLNEASKSTPKPRMLWLAEFLWRLPH